MTNKLPVKIWDLQNVRLLGVPFSFVKLVSARSGSNAKALQHRALAIPPRLL